MGTPNRSIDGRWAGSLALPGVLAVPGTSGDEVTDSPTAQEEIVRAWTTTGSADALTPIHARDTGHLEEIILRLQRIPAIAHTPPQILLSELVGSG
ncbi:Lrp/AsnC ligand binding domain-containing protein [Saccharopolyspora sp. NPDC003762]